METIETQLHQMIKSAPTSFKATVARHLLQQKDIQTSLRDTILQRTQSFTKAETQVIYQAHAQEIFVLLKSIGEPCDEPKIASEQLVQTAFEAMAVHIAYELRIKQNRDVPFNPDKVAKRMVAGSSLDDKKAHEQALRKELSELTGRIQGEEMLRRLQNGESLEDVLFPKDYRS